MSGARGGEIAGIGCACVTIAFGAGHELVGHQVEVIAAEEHRPFATAISGSRPGNYDELPPESPLPIEFIQMPEPGADCRATVARSAIRDSPATSLAEAPDDVIARTPRRLAGGRRALRAR